jgi:hypothetical protein
VIIAVIALPAIALMMAMLQRMESSLTAPPPARLRPEPAPAAEPAALEPEPARAA